MARIRGWKESAVHKLGGCGVSCMETRLGELCSQGTKRDGEQDMEQGEKDNLGNEEIIKIMDIYFFASLFPQMWGGEVPWAVFGERVDGGEILLQVPEGFLQLLLLCP